jgi:hypothetical protein
MVGAFRPASARTSGSFFAAASNHKPAFSTHSKLLASWNSSKLLILQEKST